MSFHGDTESRLTFERFKLRIDDVGRPSVRLSQTPTLNSFSAEGPAVDVCVIIGSCCFRLKAYNVGLFLYVTFYVSLFIHCNFPALSAAILINWLIIITVIP